MTAITFEALRSRLAALVDHSPRLKQQLDGVDISSLKTAADLARVPLLRKSGPLRRLQREDPAICRRRRELAYGAFKRLFLSPGPIFEAQGPWR